MVKYTLLAVVVTGAITAAGLAIVVPTRTEAESTPPANPPHSVIHAAGRIEGASEEIELRFPLSGQVEEILTEEGQFVQSGQALLSLDNRVYQHAVSVAKAEVEREVALLARLVNGARSQELQEARSIVEGKTAQLRHAEALWKRTETMWREDSGVISDEAVDAAQARLASARAEVAESQCKLDLLQAPPRPDELRAARANVAAARARLQLAQTKLDQTRLQASCAGHVLQINVQRGEMTGPDAEVPSLILVDMRRLKVRAFVEEFYAPSVRVGDVAIVTADGLPGQRLRGRVIRTSPRMTARRLQTDRPAERFDTRTREVWIALESQQEVVLGLPVDVTIELQKGRSPTKRSPVHRGPDDTLGKASQDLRYTNRAILLRANELLSLKDSSQMHALVTQAKPSEVRVGPTTPTTRKK